MKIFYKIENLTNYGNCVNVCPVKNKENNQLEIYVGSCSCKHCEFCYGHSSDNGNLILFGKKDGSFEADEERWVKCAGVYKTNSLTLGIKFQLFIHKIKMHFEDIKEKIYYFFLFQKWKRLFGK